MSPHVVANNLNCSKTGAIEIGRKADSLTYLGSMVNGDQNVSEEITNRLIAANRSHFGLKSQLLSLKTKNLIYKTLVRPLLIYAVETWTTTKIVKD
jgi:hypothetical protein